MSLTRNSNQKKNKKILKQNGQTLYDTFVLVLYTFKDKTGLDLKDCLFKNTGIEFTNIILSIIFETPVGELSSSGTRNKIVNKKDFDNDIKEDILSLYTLTTSGDVNLFHNAVETLEKKTVVN
uniref:E3 UFM1-protein ligase 1-like domain-containing protein n=1 Tax=Strongyloides venezuelensis TaxID=75913 RepID=A0A0K0G667_STRVS